MPNHMLSENFCLEKVGSVVQQTAMPVTYIALLYIYIMYIHIHIFMCILTYSLHGAESFLSS